MVNYEYDIEIFMNIKKEIMERQKFRITPFQTMISAVVGAVITSSTMTPLDVVKTRMQIQSGFSPKFFYYRNGLMDHLCCSTSKEEVWYRRPSQFSGTLDGIRKIWKCEGLLSLWSGLGPTLLLALPTTVLFFVSYEELKFLLDYKHSLTQPLWIPAVSASVARFVTTFISSPIELIRTKMQAQSMKYLELQNVLKNMLFLDGYRGLWKGVGATLLRDTTFSGIYWFGFEAIKSLNPGFKFEVENNFFAGTTAGIIASVITTPFDVAKTNIQIQSAEEMLMLTESQIKDKIELEINVVLRKIYNQNGIRGLFAGLLPRTIRVAPSCAIMIASFEYVKSVFAKLNAKRNLEES